MAVGKVGPVRKPSLVEALTERLREEILNGRFRKGTTLPPERSLAEDLQVNRTSLKHALVKLEQLGLIAIRHGIGSVVLDPIEHAGAELISYLIFRSGGVDPEMLADLIEARTLMGGFLARLAASRRSDEHLMRLREVLASLDETNDPMELQKRELDFFAAIVVATRNRALVLLANSVFAVYRSHSRAFQGAFTDRAFVVDCLRAVADAIEAGDGATAEEKALEYLHENGRRLKSSAAGKGA